MENSHFIVRSYLSDNTGLSNAGSVSLGNDFASRMHGPITLENNILGMVDSSIYSMSMAYDAFYQQLPDTPYRSLLQPPQEDTLAFIRFASQDGLRAS